MFNMIEFTEESEDICNIRIVAVYIDVFTKPVPLFNVDTVLCLGRTPPRSSHDVNDVPRNSSAL